jgi:hypothetical protein
LIAEKFGGSLKKFQADDGVSLWGVHFGKFPEMLIAENGGELEVCSRILLFRGGPTDPFTQQIELLGFQNRTDRAVSVAQ